MAAPESIHSLLIAAARLLDTAASEIRDAQLEPIQENIEHIGHALCEIFDVKQAIYAARPDLMPQHMKEPSPNPEANRRLTRYMVEALDLERDGHSDKAIEKFMEYVAFETSPFHVEIAKREIARLRGE
jgi:hypothetical protein